MKLRALHIIFIFLAGILFCRAQDETFDIGSDKITVRPAPYSVRLEMCVPNPTNAAWRKSMVGVYEGNLTFNYKIAGGFYAGVGYKNSLLYTPPKFFIFEVKTKMQMHNAFLRLGYDVYKRNNYFISPSINSGWCYTKYTHLSCLTQPVNYKPEYSTWFVEPAIAFNFLPDPNFGISFHFSYVVVNHIWDPKFICLQDHIEYGDIRQDGITNYFNLGFGVYWGIGKGKTTAGK